MGKTCQYCLNRNVFVCTPALFFWWICLVFRASVVCVPNTQIYHTLKDLPRHGDGSALVMIFDLEMFCDLLRGCVVTSATPTKSVVDRRICQEEGFSKRFGLTHCVTIKMLCFLEQLEVTRECGVFSDQVLHKPRTVHDPAKGEAGFHKRTFGRYQPCFASDFLGFLFNLYFVFFSN